MRSFGFLAIETIRATVHVRSANSALGSGGGYKWKEIRTPRHVLVNLTSFSNPDSVENRALDDRVVACQNIGTKRTMARQVPGGR